MRPAIKKLLSRRPLQRPISRALERPPTDRIKKLAVFGVVMIAALLLVRALAPAQSPSVSEERVKRVGKKLLCLCGCTQILVECNHTNCGFSTPAVAALRQALARYETDDLAIQAMVQQYGVQILAAPPAQGFNLSAWVTPFAAAAIGLFVIAVVLRRWKARPQETASGGDAADDPAWRERVRREIEKELGEEGR